MSVLSPAELVDRIAAVGAAKVTYTPTQTLVRAYMGAAILTLGAALAGTETTPARGPLLGAHPNRVG